MSLEKRSLQTVSFFDSMLNYDQMNMKVVQEPEFDIKDPKQYSLEDNKGTGALLDISALMMHRYNYGYKVD